MQAIRIGTRGSKLALWQAHYVEKLLQEKGLSTEIVLIDTKGDKVLDVSISKIGSKGVFTEEIEDQLAKGLIDIAVHSAKDMPSNLPAGFELMAFTEREQFHDVVVTTGNKVKLQDAPAGFRLGTSSTRRLALLKHFYPHIHTVSIRGNLQTRIKKMEEGQCDALLLAFAGVHRMEYDHLIAEALPVSKFVPPVGQGSVAVEVFKTLADESKIIIKEAVNHVPTETCLRAERAFLNRLNGGCSVPVFAVATLESDKLVITGGVVSLDGQTLLKETVSGKPEDAAILGNMLAQEIISQGGGEILASIKAENKKHNVL